MRQAIRNSLSVKDVRMRRSVPATHQVVFAPIGGLPLNGCRPHPEALGAWAVCGSDSKAAALPQELVEDVALALPGAPADRHDSDGARVPGEGPQRLSTDLKLLSVRVEADELLWVSRP